MMLTRAYILSSLRRFIGSELAGCILALMASFCLLAVYKKPFDPALQFSQAPEALLLTAACVVFFLSLACLFAYAALALGLDAFASYTLAAGIVYFSLWLHLRPNPEYTNDVWGHWDYLNYMISGWKNPYIYAGWEYWHPPLYYFIAGKFMQALRACNFIDPMAAPRVLSLFFYGIFCLYGLRTLQAAMILRNATYRVACLLIIFWPVGMIMATRINNDIAAYAAWSVFFYYLFCWWDSKTMAFMRKALIALSVAFMIKSNAVILAGMAGLCLCYAIAMRLWTWQQWYTRKNISVALFLGLGLLVNAGRLIYNAIYGSALSQQQFGGSNRHAIDLFSFLQFDALYFIVFPFQDFYFPMGFWDYFLKTSLYGEFTWHLSSVATAINILLLLVVATTILGNIRAQDGRAKFLMLLGIALPLIFSMVFAWDKKWVVAQDFRFVLPMLVPFVILFAYAMEHCKTIQTLRPFYALGMLSAVGMCAGGVVFYLGQYWL